MLIFASLGLHSGSKLCFCGHFICLTKLVVSPPFISKLGHNPNKLSVFHPIKEARNSNLNLMRVKNNIFCVFSKLPKYYTIECNNKPTSGRLASSLNILSIPYECTLKTRDIKITNHIALPHQIKEDVDKIGTKLKKPNYSPKTERISFLQYAN